MIFPWLSPIWYPLFSFIAWRSSSPTRKTTNAIHQNATFRAKSSTDWRKGKKRKRTRFHVLAHCVCVCVCKSENPESWFSIVDFDKKKYWYNPPRTTQHQQRNHHSREWIAQSRLLNMSTSIQRMTCSVVVVVFFYLHYRDIDVILNLCIQVKKDRDKENDQFTVLFHRMSSHSLSGVRN